MNTEARYLQPRRWPAGTVLVHPDGRRRVVIRAGYFHVEYADHNGTHRIKVESFRTFARHARIEYPKQR